MTKAGVRVHTNCQPLDIDIIVELASGNVSYIT
jgi:hypothetical protein